VDEPTDLAVIKTMRGKDFADREAGNSDGVQVGDWVLAHRQPLRIAATVTAGIISAEGPRRNRAAVPAIFTDRCGDQPGNSGDAGRPGREVIGINTAIITGSRYEGVGFALALDHGDQRYDQMSSRGRVTRGIDRRQLPGGAEHERHHAEISGRSLRA